MIKFTTYGAIIEDSYKVFEKNPDINEYFDMILGYVHPSFRCHGIGFKLIEQDVELVRTRNISIMKSTCTSLYTAKIMESLKFEKVFEIPFKNFTFFGNEILDNIKEPHDVAKVYLKRI